MTVNINLRKAHALQTSILEKLKALEPIKEVRLNQFEHTTDILSNAKSDAMSKIDRKVKLLDTLYSIRTFMAEANSRNEIDKSLTNIAYFDKIIQLYQSLVDSPVRLSNEFIDGKILKMKNAKEESFHDQHFTTGLFTQEELKDFESKVTEFKRQKQALQDRILALNLTCELVLSDLMVETLQSEGLL